MKRNPLYVVGRIVVIPIFKLLFFYKVKGKHNVPDEGNPRVIAGGRQLR